MSEKPKPMCPNCGNDEGFEVLDSDWVVNEDGTYGLVEKVLCPKCKFETKATYQLISWEEWKE